MTENSALCLESEDSINFNNGLAAVMNKILSTSKPKRKKTVILAKAKKLSQIKMTLKGNCNEEMLQSNQVKNSAWIRKGRIKPNPIERNNEKRLLKITISGVVNLFNAVNQYKNINEKSNPVIKKGSLKEIDKTKFLGILLNGSVSSDNKNAENGQVEIDVDVDDKLNSSDTWNVLRKDFVDNTKWKNWDKALLEKK